MNQQVPDDLISAYFDGEVTQDERRRVEQLLESSAESRQLLEDAAKLSAILHSFPRAAAPADLARNVQQQIESAVLVAPASNPLKRSGLRREWIIFSGGVLATVVPLVLFIVMNPMDHREKSAAVDRRFAADEAGGMGGHGPQDMARAEKRPRTAALKMHEMLPEAPGAAKPIGGSPTPKLEDIYDVVSNETAATSRSPLKSSAAGGSALVSSVVTHDESLFSQPVVDVTDDGISLMPDDPDHFIQSLKRGEIAVRSVANTNDAVAIVELVVIDVNRGVDEMEMLLLRVLRNVKEDNSKAGVAKQSESSDPSVVSDESLKESLSRTKSSDDLAMLYVRAPGDQLAQALAEAVKRPEIYLAVSPKVPMTFPGEQNARLSLATNHEADAKSAVVIPNAEKPVSVEAGLVVNSFLDQNGIEVKSKDGKVNIKQNGMAREYSYHAHPGTETSPSVPVAVSDEPAADATGLENPQQGFTSLRFSVDNDAVPQDQKRGKKQNLNSRKLLQNATLPKGGSQEAGAPPQPSEQVHRDSQLVRMLIVLKSGQPTSPP